MFNKEELDQLEGVINEEILSILESGYGTKNSSVVILRGILRKLNLKEYYNFDKYGEDDE